MVPIRKHLASGLVFATFVLGQTAFGQAAPFTVKMHSAIGEAGRPETRRDLYYREAFRADGSSLWANLDSKLQTTARRIQLVREGRQVTTAEPVRLKSTVRVRDWAVAHWKSRHRDSSCTGRVFGAVALAAIGDATVLGVAVLKFREDTPRATVEVWRAPSLNCYRLFERFEWKSQGAVVSTTTNTAISITVGDPDPALFQVPDSFREVKPSEAAARLREFFEAAEEQHPAVKADKARKYRSLDEAYERANPK